jgi:Antibiotic biosynthesis monooxygenase.
VLALSRFDVSEQAADGFVERARPVLVALSTRPGFLDGRLVRAVDDPSEWLLVTEWEGAGFYRRALLEPAVAVLAAELFAGARDEPSAFEVLATVAPGGAEAIGRSDRNPRGTPGPR